MRSGYTASDPQASAAQAAAAVTLCPVCDARMAESFRDQEAVYKRCPSCDYLKPCLLDLDAFAVNVEIYSERYDAQIETAAVVTDKARRKYARLLDRVEPERKTGRLLDVGCGAGRLLACAAERGWRAFGADPSMSRLAGDPPEGVEIRAALLHECGFEDGSFDVVHANEVMEHVDEVVPLVREMRRVLRPGGLLVLRTPNHRSWTARAVGPRWRHYGVAEVGHVGFFSPKTFAVLFERTGLELLRVDTQHFSLRDRWPCKAPVLGSVCRASFKAVALLATAAGAGERLTVWARKT